MQPVTDLPARFRLPAPRQRQLLEAMGDGCYVNRIVRAISKVRTYVDSDGNSREYRVRGMSNMALNSMLCGLLVRWPTKQRFRGGWKPIPNDGPGWAVRWKRPDPERSNREFFWWAQTDYGRACLRMLEAQEGRLQLDRIESGLLEGIRAGDPGALNIYGDWLTENGIREPQVETWGRGVDFTQLG